MYPSDKEEPDLRLTRVVCIKIQSVILVHLQLDQGVKGAANVKSTRVPASILILCPGVILETPAPTFAPVLVPLRPPMTPPTLAALAVLPAVLRPLPLYATA